MPASDYLSAVYDAIWAALEAHAAWPVKAANRIKLSDSSIDPMKKTWNDSDFPEATLLYGNINDSLFTLSERYNFTPTFDPAAAGNNWTERIEQVYTLLLIHQDLRGPKSAMLKLETLTALRKVTGAPRLGKSYVQRVGPITSGGDQIVVGRAGEADTGGTKRLLTVLNIPVLMRFNGSDLIT
jgi:hypothetical protein